MKFTQRLAISIATLITAGGMMSSTAFAQTTTSSTDASPTKWEKNHPRRAEVNARLANQNKRITNEVKEGEITHAQAKELRSNDKAIRSEEKAMASQHGTHITKTEKKALNQELNQNSKEIGK